jgi:uncharacterized membrane protein
VRLTRPPPPPRPEDPIAKNIRAMVELAQEARDDRTHMGRVTDTIARTAGSLTFIAIHAVWFTGWIGLNLTRFAFDPYPFSFLNLVVVLEAVILTSVVLLTQNHMTQLADRRAALDLQINLLSEQELTAMLHMLNGLCGRLGVHISIHDERVQQLLAETDVHKIAVALDLGLDPPKP